MKQLKKFRKTKVWYLLVTKVISRFKPSENIYKHLIFHGPFEVDVQDIRFKLVHFGSNFENDLFWRGVEYCWEAKSVLLWKNICGQCTTIFDIGANTGFYALLSKATSPNVAVFAFEPLKRIFNSLQRNIEENGFGDIVTKQVALSKESGSSVIYDQPDNPSMRQASLNRRFHTEANRVPVEIELTTAAQFIEDNDIQNIDLIKLDVEEHEMEVLMGFGKYIELYKPAIMIEIQNGSYGKEIERYLREKGYDYFINVSETSGYYEVQNMEASHGRNYFCFTSKDHFLNMCSENVIFNLRTAIDA